MKKLLILFLVSCFTIFLKCQDLQFGISVDPGLSWFSSNDKAYENNGTSFSFNYGLSLDKYFADNYAFSSGISIQHSGGKILFKEPINIKIDDSLYIFQENSQLRIKMQYIRIPLGLKLKTNEIGYLTFFARVGISPQINVKSTTEASSLNLYDFNFIKETSLFEIGYFFGGGLEYSLGGETSLYAGVIFNNGFTNVLSDLEKVTLNNLLLRIGVLF